MGFERIEILHDLLIALEVAIEAEEKGEQLWRKRYIQVLSILKSFAMMFRFVLRHLKEMKSSQSGPKQGQRQVST